MPNPTYQDSQADALQALRNAITANDPNTIRTALPEPPTFLATLFKLDAPDRDTILANVFPVLDSEEDQWEVIEAAATDTITHPDRRSFLAVVPYISAKLLDDANKLVARFTYLDVATEVKKALIARSSALGMDK